MGRSSLEAEFLEGLDERLPAHASDTRRRWWTSYLKGEAEFRGVKLADVRATVDDLVVGLHLEDATATTYLSLAQAAMSRRFTEDKLAGVLLLAEHGLPTLQLDHLDELAAPLASGHLADWNSCDWYCVKVLSGFVQGEEEIELRSRAVGAWREADGLWQRRAAAVSFVHVASFDPAPFGGFIDLMVEICHRNAEDETRWSQTSVGWLLRELSLRYPEVVRRFVADHPQLSTEARRNALKKLD